jgi:hypothetical protein
MKIYPANCNMMNPRTDIITGKISKEPVGLITESLSAGTIHPMKRHVGKQTIKSRNTYWLSERVVPAVYSITTIENSVSEYI